MASLQTVYGEPWISSSGQPSTRGESPLNSPFANHTDGTPKALALMLLFWGGVLYLLNYYGFRFNFGVAGGK